MFICVNWSHIPCIHEFISYVMLIFYAWLFVLSRTKIVPVSDLVIKSQGIFEIHVNVELWVTSEDRPTDGYRIVNLDIINICRCNSHKLASMTSDPQTMVCPVRRARAFFFLLFFSFLLGRGGGRLGWKPSFCRTKRPILRLNWGRHNEWGWC